MQRISNRVLRDYFIGWQCRIRQMAMRDHGGRPMAGMRPRVATRSGTLLSRAMAILLRRQAEPEASTAFLKFQLVKNNDTQRAFEAGVKYMGGEHYQRPELFSDEMTAVFAGDSATARAMLEERKVVLDFEQYSQAFLMFCKVRRLGLKDEAREASLWQARIFNPRIPNDAIVLGFRPDWKNATADPMPR